jgi:hypothetical protein
LIKQCRFAAVQMQDTRTRLRPWETCREEQQTNGDGCWRNGTVAFSVEQKFVRVTSSMGLRSPIFDVVITWNLVVRQRTCMHPMKNCNRNKPAGQLRAYQPTDRIAPDCFCGAYLGVTATDTNSHPRKSSNALLCHEHSRWGSQVV